MRNRVFQHIYYNIYINRCNLRQLSRADFADISGTATTWMAQVEVRRKKQGRRVVSWNRPRIGNDQFLRRTQRVLNADGGQHDPRLFELVTGGPAKFIKHHKAPQHDDNSFDLRPGIGPAWTRGGKRNTEGIQSCDTDQDQNRPK